MQLLLDEVQSEGVDELDKVSLERLAEINPNLLADIKNAAEGILSEGGGEGSSGGDQVGAAPMGVEQLAPEVEAEVQRPLQSLYRPACRLPS